MDTALRTFSQMLSTALLVTVILAGVAIGIASLVVFLMARRAWQYFRTRRFDAVSIKIHGQWREIVRGAIPAGTWRNNSLRCEILQSIVIQEIGATTNKDRAGLQAFLRTSGLLDRCIERVHRGKGWSRRRAMLARAVMNGETTDPEGWRATFPTYFSATPMSRSRHAPLAKMTAENPQLLHRSSKLTSLPSLHAGINDTPGFFMRALILSYSCLRCSTCQRGRPSSIFP